MKRKKSENKFRLTDFVNLAGLIEMDPNACHCLLEVYHGQDSQSAAFGGLFKIRSYLIKALAGWTIVLSPHGFAARGRAPEIILVS